MCGFRVRSLAVLTLRTLARSSHWTHFEGLSVLFLQLPAAAFSVTNLPFTEPMLSVWAQLVNLAGSKLEKHKIKKSPKQGFAGQYMCFMMKRLQS